MAEDLADVPACERVLLLPHCLRPSGRCPGRPSREGFQCPPDCPVSDCPIRVLRAEAERLGYKGVCVAPGGALALRYVQEKRPRVVMAVACEKELLEGREAVAKLSNPPVVRVLPLMRDGCVDTEVDLTVALRLLSEGLPLVVGQETVTTLGKPREGPVGADPIQHQGREESERVG